MKRDYPQNIVIIGKILKPRGVSGETKVLSLTDIPGRFEQLESVYIETAPDDVRTLAIMQVKHYKNFVYLRFQGVDSVEAVEELRGRYLYVDAADVPALPDGIYYHFEIIGAEVYTDDDRYLGTVTEILETGAHDVYVVKQDQREFLIPSHPEIVVRIDRDNGRIIVHPLEGLFEL